MKLKRLLSLLLFLTMCQHINAQQLNNIYEDALLLKSYVKSNKLLLADSGKWMPVLKKYVPVEYQTNYSKFLSYFSTNPFGLRRQIFIGELAGQSASFADATASIPTAPSPLVFASTGFSAPVFADAMAQLIIKRAKEELTATFFYSLKRNWTGTPNCK